VAICQTIVEIRQFFSFSKWWLSEIMDFKIWNFMVNSIEMAKMSNLATFREHQ